MKPIFDEKLTAEFAEEQRQKLLRKMEAKKAELCPCPETRQSLYDYALQYRREHPEEFS